MSNFSSEKIKFYDLHRETIHPLIKTHIDTKPFTLYEDTPLGEAMVQVADFVGESIAVVESSTCVLKGAVSEGDLFGAVIAVQGEVVAMERGG